MRRESVVKAFVVLVLMHFLLGCTSQRQVARQGAATVYGRVVEHESGLPLSGAGVSLRGPVHQKTDARGHYAIEVLEPGKVDLFVTCPTQARMPQRLIGLESEDVGAGERRRLDIVVDASRCTEPPEISIVDEFHGHWISGFEESSFAPCESLALPRREGDPGEVRIYVEFAERVRGIPASQWPPGSMVEDGGIQHYVRWKGRLTGPGELNLGDYELLVEEVLEIREPEAMDCAKG